MEEVEKIKLHPDAKDFLFENYAILRRIFSDVLGQLEIDYISIALINNKREIFFLSSNPSIEQNLIEKELWDYDYIYQAQFIYQNEIKLWSEINLLVNADLLKHYKQQSQKLIEGISIPTNYRFYRAVFSFGFQKIDALTKIRFDNYEKLLVMGHYCLNKISNLIVFPDQNKIINKPKLTLIVNNLGKL